MYFNSRTEVPFITRFVEEVAARRPERLPRPREEKDLSIYAAWKFAEQGKRTLIFITQANWVEGYGDMALELVERGYLPSLLDDPEAIERAVEVGKEWLGDDHCAVKCLQIGVAVHHGGLPNPFLRELELLLSRGTIKVTVASPTLSQGLNLNAAVMLVPILHRSGKLITGEEFANVAGRAGRAFVDVEGLVIHVMHRGGEWRLQEWRNLVASARSRTLGKWANTDRECHSRETIRPGRSEPRRCLRISRKFSRSMECRRTSERGRRERAALAS